ncbi:MAG: hypothetical protein ABFD25_15570 [Clostridiaceae bacterium]
MKISLVIKGLLKNYRIVFILFGMEFILQFTQIQRRFLQQTISDLYKNKIMSDTVSDFVSSSLPLIYQTVTYLVLWICVFSGVLYLCKKIIHHEEANMGDFVHGLESNWKNVFTVGLIFTLTFGLLKDILQGLISGLRFFDNVIFVYVKSAVSSSLSIFYTALIPYGSLMLIENKIKIRELFSSILNFIFSREALKLYIILLFAGCLLQPVNMIKNQYMLSSSLTEDSLFSIMDIISTFKPPLWLKIIEWFINTIITAFTVMYVSLIFYNKPGKAEFID